jgi:hypothetical protein
MLGDIELPFYHIKQQIMQDVSDPQSDEGKAQVKTQLAWPKDIVIARRIESLCELVLKPRPPPKRPASSRKRPHDGNGPRGKRSHTSSTLPKHYKLTMNGPVRPSTTSQGYVSSSENGDDDGGALGGDDYDSGEDTDDILQEATKRMQHRISGSSTAKKSASRGLTKPLKSQPRKGSPSSHRMDWHHYHNGASTNPYSATASLPSSSSTDDDEMQLG